MLELRVKLLGVFVGVVFATAISHASTLAPATRPGNSSRTWIPRGFHAVRDISYVPHGRRSQSLDVYVPDIATAPRPLIVWIHGGGWFSGDKYSPPGMGLLTRGYVVASINYRFSTEAVFPAQIFDCKAAIRYLRAHARQFDVDPTRVGVWGDSAGGHLAVLLGTTNGRADYEGIEGTTGVSSDVQAVCDWFGPVDFLTNNDLTLAGQPVVRQLFGGTVATHLALARFASPVEQLTASAEVGPRHLPSFLIMHGDQDRLVPVHQSQLLYQKLKLAGTNVRLIVLPKAGHGYGWFSSRDDLTTVYDFFDRCFHPSRLRAGVATTRPAA